VPVISEDSQRDGLAAADAGRIQPEPDEQQLERIIGDMAMLAVKLRKPLSRLMPVKGKSKGEKTEFKSPFLVNTALQTLP
jgi:hypothetical protein